MRHCFQKRSLVAPLVLAGALVSQGCTIFVAPDPSENEPEALAPRQPEGLEPRQPDTGEPATPAPGTPSPEGSPGAEPDGEPATEPEGEPEPGCVNDAAFYETQVEPILASCKGCHIEDGLAAHTRLVLQDAPTPEAIATNRSRLQALATDDLVADPLFILKPTLELPHTGGQLFAADAPEVATLREMTNRFRQPGACTDPGAQQCADLATFVQPTVRRLSPAELERTLGDLFPETALPTLLFIAPENRNLFENQSLSSANSALSTEYDHINAEAIAQAVAQDFSPYLSCSPAEGAACGRTFVQENGRRLFRRPLTVEEEDLFSAIFEDSPVSDDFAVAAEVALQAMLTSPVFLYRVEVGQDALAPATTLTAFETATRLSYFLWGTAPDAALLDAAETGALSTSGGVASEVDRMLEDPKAEEGLMELFRAWLDTGAVANVEKPAEANFTPAVRASLVEESDRFLRDIVLGESPTLETLLTANETFVDANIAPLYGLPPPSQAWERVTHVEPRFGVLTQGAFLASRGHANQPSPIRRSVFMLNRLMCFEIGSPPPEAEGAEVEVEGQQTNRQATDALTLNGSCRGCHAVINPLGFALERYGTTGAMRDTDNGLPIDDTGAFALYAFEGAAGLATTLNSSGLVSHCVAERFSQYALGHSLLAGECFISDVQATFEASGNNFFALVRAIATHPAFAFGTLDKSYAPSVQ